MQKDGYQLYGGTFPQFCPTMTIDAHKSLLTSAPKRPAHAQAENAQIQRARLPSAGPPCSRPPRTWIWPLALLVVAIVAVPLRILEEAGLPRYRSLKNELHKIQQQNHRSAHEVRVLKSQVEALRKDPKAIERIARDELGMVREGEVVFQFSQ